MRRETDGRQVRFRRSEPLGSAPLRRRRDGKDGFLKRRLRTDGKVQPAESEPTKARSARWSEQTVDRAQKRELVSTLNEAWKTAA